MISFEKRFESEPSSSCRFEPRRRRGTGPSVPSYSSDHIRSALQCVRGAVCQAAGEARLAREVPERIFPLHLVEQSTRALQHFVSGSRVGRADCGRFAPTRRHYRHQASKLTPLPTPAAGVFRLRLRAAYGGSPQPRRRRRQNP
jgi:hypothetical protein